MDQFFHPLPMYYMIQLNPLKMCPEGCIFWSNIFFPVPLTKLRQKQVVRSPPWAASVLFCTRGFQKSFPGLDKYASGAKCLLSCHICGELHLPPASIIPNCFQSEWKLNEGKPICVNPSRNFKKYHQQLHLKDFFGLKSAQNWFDYWMSKRAPDIILKLIVSFSSILSNLCSINFLKQQLHVDRNQYREQ